MSNSPNSQDVRRRWSLLVTLLLVSWGCVSADETEVVAGSDGHEATALATTTVPDEVTPPPARSPRLQPAASSATTAPDAPRTRVVWTRDVGDGTDILSHGNQLILMAYDSKAGNGERVLRAEPASYAKPLITSDGSRVVYTVRSEGAVYTTRWKGSRQRRIAKGFALAVWVDPDTADEWVYVGDDEEPTDPPSYHSIYRYRLTGPRQRELVWNAQPVSGDGFQLSADGRYAGALFPWPHAGVADLAAGTWEPLGQGCWTSFTGDGSDLFWYFDGSHRSLTLVDIKTDQRWQVEINGAPGIDGFEVWHPRWTNDSRYFVVTGPYTVGRRANKIRGGGNQVEVWVGRFTEDFSSVEEWTRITRNDKPDFYPDAWVKPSDTPRGARVANRPDLDPPTAESAFDRHLVVEARVRHETSVPTPESIAPYKNGLHALEYDVVKVVEGTYDAPTLVVASWVIRDGEVLDGARRPAGSAHRMVLELYDARPELEGERLVMDTTAFELPLYYDVNSLP